MKLVKMRALYQSTYLNSLPVIQERGEAGIVDIDRERERAEYGMCNRSSYMGSSIYIDMVVSV